ncbi:unnamed protein product [Zymoseptoria tritici ST99CH_3D7]|uniref:Arrestin C-terminal-like domain-containing protein n=1 Tax=Zymoseptoria tritici (strain ST99CH_3D7) TaxID=1276538 RepID=A0A1X7RY21_ZYMT9|nr:unnamed protein product [Zymoseptoria tritici ST99CH_3D7]
MLSPADRSPSTPTSGRRLLSRIASPFASKSRNITDYYITVDDPHKQYSQGDVVSGSVHLKVVKPTRVTHVVVCLHGFVQVYKNPGSPPADGYRANNTQAGSGRGSKTGEYFGNGFATLFEDEVVLCGDGRLGEGVYQFNFNLEFPDKDLPSSISFERGTVSYMITATLTRPTTMSPTIRCDHKVYLLERIDISHLYPPKPRTITLEPVSRKKRLKPQVKKVVDSSGKSIKGDSNVHSSEQERRGSHTSSALSSSAIVEVNRQSPNPSDLSIDGPVSSGGPVSHPGSHANSRLSQLDSEATSPRSSDENRAEKRTITATVESLSGGCLRGDTASIKVHVDHTKHVKSLHGVIITLYRQARVDMHPAIPLGPSEKGKERKFEDYYPKSVSGLGGLSLSGAGSSHVFRKDLSQTIMPLIIDPNTLTAEVTGKVNIPEEAFPTISTVPGAMISFRYFIEVILDIQGKLSSHDRNLGNLGGLASTIVQGPEADPIDRRHGSPVIDTSAVRRNMGVVACTFEIIIGTRDSARRKGKQKAEPLPVSDPNAQAKNEADTQAGATPHAADHGNGEYWYDESNGFYDQEYYGADQYAPGYGEYNGYHGEGGYFGNGSYTMPHPIPIPEIEDDSQLPEKERLRRAEARLLPSMPPGADQPGSSREAASHEATAPFLEEEHLNGYSHPAGPSRQTLLTPPAHPGGHSTGTHAFSAFSTPAHMPPSPSYEPHNIPLPRTPLYNSRDAPTPSYEPPNASTPSYGFPSTPTPIPSRHGPTDDKRELQRRQLELEASAPPQDDDASESGPAPRDHDAAPTAPVLSETEEAMLGLGNSSREEGQAQAGAAQARDLDLPRYER